MKKIVLYGAGGLAREIANMIEIINSIEIKKGNIGKYDLLGFLDDNVKVGTNINGYKILGNSEWIFRHKEVFCTCSIANVSVKKKIHDFLNANGVKFESLIAPDVYVPPSTKIGKDCVIVGHTLLSVNMNIEDGVFINSGVSLGHDVFIDKYSCIMPGTSISGYCKIGKQVTVGGHTFIVPRKNIGDRVIIAAGSVVFGNVKSGTTVLGNPAKRMRALEK